MGLATGPAFRAISGMKKFWHQDHDGECSGGCDDGDDNGDGDEDGDDVDDNNGERESLRVMSVD